MRKILFAILLALSFCGCAELGMGNDFTVERVEHSRLSEYEYKISIKSLKHTHSGVYTLHTNERYTVGDTLTLDTKR